MKIPCVFGDFSCAPSGIYRVKCGTKKTFIDPRWVYIPQLVYIQMCLLSMNPTWCFQPGLQSQLTPVPCLDCQPQF